MDEDNKSEKIEQEEAADEPLDTLIGKTEEVAFAALKEAGWEVRVRSRDGVPFVGTYDFRMDRVGVHIVDGKITKIVIG